MKLLIIDDYWEIVEILSTTMEMSGHEVDKAYDGVEAVNKLQNDSYDVVIVDAEMPRMGGIEVCKFLRLQFPDVYIIGVSGNCRALKELKNAGADICLSKPFHIDVVEEIIAHLYCTSRSGFDSTSFYCNNGLL
ncbi:MAG TPA: response regulator [Syntrophales bacterium]|nr:response regulator [Syntrophales bacterium]